MTFPLPCTPREGLIPGPAGRLEILLTCPKLTSSSSPSANPYAVVCHPHPLHGGAMTNKVVYMIANTFNALGVGTVRFNFRGVGKSTGSYDHGNGETEDLVAVVNWLRTEMAPSELWLAGFSFGGYIALRAHQALEASRLLLVAPAVNKLDFSDLQLSSIPTLIIQGERDDVVPPQAVSEWLATQRQVPQLERLPTADHFFHGQLNELREVILKAWGG